MDAQKVPLQFVHLITFGLWLAPVSLILGHIENFSEHWELVCYEGAGHDLFPKALSRVTTWPEVNATASFSH
jgi:hypothetical protein